MMNVPFTPYVSRSPPPMDACNNDDDYDMPLSKRNCEYPDDNDIEICDTKNCKMPNHIDVTAENCGESIEQEPSCDMAAISNCDDSTTNVSLPCTSSKNSDSYCTANNNIGHVLNDKNDHETSLEDDFGDFADFSEFTESSVAAVATCSSDAVINEAVSSAADPSVEVLNESGWAEFGGATDGEPQSSCGDDDDWASFEVCLSEPQLSSQEFAQIQDQPQDKEKDVTFDGAINDLLCSLSHLDYAILKDFSDCSFLSLLNLMRESEADINKETSDVGSDNDTDQIAYQRLLAETWQSIRCIEETLALKYTWLDSSSQKNYFDCLHVNPALLKLSTSHLPAFAAQLGTGLVPLKPSAGVDSCTTSMDAPAIASCQKINATTEQVAEPRPFGQSAVQDSLSVPPVEFDWSSSGLTNPLAGEGYAAQNALLDLDFLANAYSATRGDSALKKDLERLGLGTDDAGGLSLLPGSRALEQLLSKAPLTLTAKNSLTGLNSGSGPGSFNPDPDNKEVLGLLSRIPNLEFMLSPVLMFPVKNNI